MKIEIITGLDLPKPKIRNAYPFLKMEIGDAFFVDNSKSRAARAAASRWGRDHNQRYCSKSTENGVTIHRVE